MTTKKVLNCTKHKRTIFVNATNKIAGFHFMSNPHGALWLKKFCLYHYDYLLHEPYFAWQDHRYQRPTVLYDNLSYKSAFISQNWSSYKQGHLHLQTKRGHQCALTNLTYLLKVFLNYYPEMITTEGTERKKLWQTHKYICDVLEWIKEWGGWMNEWMDGQMWRRTNHTLCHFF